MKNVYVVLGFHAHEASKEIGNQILQEAVDPDIKKLLPFDNVLAKNAPLVRDTFLALIQLSKNLNIPICLAASNEILSQLRNIAPETFTKLREAYQERSIYPILNFAYEAHILLTSPEEVADEVRMNTEFIEDVLEITLARYIKHKGVFPPECSIDGKKTDAFAQAGLEYVLAPHLEDQFFNFTVTPPGKVEFTPLQFENGVVVFPRNHKASEGLWQVLTRLKPKWAAQQGYLLGEYPVFTEEYTTGQYLKFPLSLQEAIDEYTNILRQVITDVPDNGVIFSMQKLDMLNFGEWALGIIGAAWMNVMADNVAQIRFVTPDTILDEKPKSSFPRIKFDEISWFPENRVIVNIDGQYPPLGIAEYNGYKVGEKLWKRWPFIFWEPGRQLTTIIHSLYNSYGHKATSKLKVREMLQQNLMQVDLEEQYALHLRMIKRASNWVSSLEEDSLREVFLHAYYVLRRMSVAHLDPARFQRISDETLTGLDATLDILLGQRILLLQSNIKKMEQTKMVSYPLAYTYLSGAAIWKDKASFALRNAQNLNRSGKNVQELVVHLCECCKDVCLCLNNIKHTHKDLPEKEYVYTEMYKQLYKTFPPKLHSSLDMLLYK